MTDPLGGIDHHGREFATQLLEAGAELGDTDAHGTDSVSLGVEDRCGNGPGILVELSVRHRESVPAHAVQFVAEVPTLCDRVARVGGEVACGKQAFKADLR